MDMTLVTFARCKQRQSERYTGGLHLPNINIQKQLLHLNEDMVWATPCFNAEAHMALLGTYII